MLVKIVSKIKIAEVDIRRRTTSLQIFYFVDLTDIFKSDILNVNIAETAGASSEIP